MDALVLAGGFGTRLRSIIQDIPKPMALIGGKPFLAYLLTYLSVNGVTRVVLCTGYKHDVVETYFGATYAGMNIIYSVETTPLGTGGAVMRAMQHVHDNACLVLNGDTFFKVDIAGLISAFTQSNADVTLALKPMTHFSRYGTVTRGKDRILSFEEKRYCQSGEINGGVYYIKKSMLVNAGYPETFSLEKDFLEPGAHTLTMTGFVENGYFIDIGIPEDYERAQQELPVLFQSFSQKPE
jgi:D-glycero-alpha-D-manno-heptose 1-phosphate guanylyltransferase